MAIILLLISLILFTFHSLQIFIIVALNLFAIKSDIWPLSKVESLAGFYFCIQVTFLCFSVCIIILLLMTRFFRSCFVATLNIDNPLGPAHLTQSSYFCGLQFACFLICQVTWLDYFTELHLPNSVSFLIFPRSCSLSLFLTRDYSNFSWTHFENLLF